MAAHAPAWLRNTAPRAFPIPHRDAIRRGHALAVPHPQMDYSTAPDCVKKLEPLLDEVTALP
jgi:hypothetical protein